MSSVATTLPQGAGYGVVIGVGFFFAILMMGISYLQNRYTRFSTKHSEEFNTASRNVKPGLIGALSVAQNCKIPTCAQLVVLSARGRGRLRFYRAVRSPIAMAWQGHSGTLQEPPCRSSCSPYWLAKV